MKRLVERVERVKTFLLLIVSLTFLGGCASLGENETDIELSEVPGVVIEAARRAVPGIELTGAEIEIEDGETVYELEGTTADTSWEIELSPDGEVLEIEEDSKEEEESAK